MPDAPTVEAPAPARPYTVATAPVGHKGTPVPYRVYPDGRPGDWLSGDEQAVEAYVGWLEGRVRELEAAGEGAPPAEVQAPAPAEPRPDPRRRNRP